MRGGGSRAFRRDLPIRRAIGPSTIWSAPRPSRPLTVDRRSAVRISLFARPIPIMAFRGLLTSGSRTPRATSYELGCRRTCACLVNEYVEFWLRKDAVDVRGVAATVLRALVVIMTERRSVRRNAHPVTTGAKGPHGTEAPGTHLSSRSGAPTKPSLAFRLSHYRRANGGVA